MDAIRETYHYIKPVPFHSIEWKVLDSFQVVWKQQDTNRNVANKHHFPIKVEYI